MNTNDLNKKYKKPKQKTTSTTNPEPSTARREENGSKTPESLCPLLAKDSEWVDILQATSEGTDKSSSSVPDEEEVLQLVECEDGPQSKPLAIMFPDLVDKDPQTLQGVINKVMSTTEVTRHLVDLGQKANFTFMKKADRLIPPDKQWMESLTENTNSICSMDFDLHDDCISSDYEPCDEAAEHPVTRVKKKSAAVATYSMSPSRNSLMVDERTEPTTAHPNENGELINTLPSGPHTNDDGNAENQGIQ